MEARDSLLEPIAEQADEVQKANAYMQAENAALLVKVEGLKDETKHLVQHQNERNSSFNVYKTETSSKIRKFVKEKVFIASKRDRYKEQLTELQNANVDMSYKNALLQVRLEQLDQN